MSDAYGIFDDPGEFGFQDYEERPYREADLENDFYEPHPGEEEDPW